MLSLLNTGINPKVTVIFRVLKNEITASKRNLTQWFLVVLWLSFIFVLSGKSFTSQNTSAIIAPIFHWLIPGMSATSLDTVHQLLRKLGHFIEYYIVGFLLFNALQKDSGGLQTWRWIVRAVIILFLCAGGDELHQSFVPGRSASLADVGLDTVSGVLAQMVSMLRRHRVGVQASDRKDVSTKTENSS